MTEVQWRTPLILLTFVLVVSVFLYGASRLHRLGIALVITAFGVASLWLLTEAAIRTDYRDADGYGDCWPHCTALQDSVGAMHVVAPVALVALILVMAALITRHASRRLRRTRGD
jgi:hypothetical protein